MVTVMRLKYCNIINVSFDSASLLAAIPFLYSSVYSIGMHSIELISFRHAAYSTVDEF